jgi:hypothetical protein
MTSAKFKDGSEVLDLNNGFDFTAQVGISYMGSMVGSPDIKIGINTDKVFNYDNEFNENYEIELRFEANEMPPIEYYYDVYFIPQLFGKKPMYISDRNYEYDVNDSNKILSCNFTFKFLSSLFRTSGKEVDSFICLQPAVGLGYAFPKVNDDKSITLDEGSLSFTSGVSYLQIEKIGNCAHGGDCVMGYIIDEKENVQNTAGNIGKCTK